MKEPRMWKEAGDGLIDSWRKTFVPILEGEAGMRKQEKNKFPALSNQVHSKYFQ